MEGKPFPPIHFGPTPHGWQAGDPATDDIIELGWRVALALEDEQFGWGPLWDRIIADDLGWGPVAPAPTLAPGEPF